VTQNASNVFRPSGLVIRKGLLCQLVEPAGNGILLDLLVPHRRVVFLKPLAKGGKLTGRECFDLSLLPLNLCHE
jgi:hypothetical protein